MPYLAIMRISHFQMEICMIFAFKISKTMVTKELILFIVAEAVFEKNSSGRQKSAIRFLEKSGYVVTKASA